METITAEWIGERKARVLSRSLTGPSLAVPTRANIDPNILKHVRRTKPQRSPSSTSSPLPYSSDGSLPMSVRSRHSSHDSVICVKAAHSADGTAQGIQNLRQSECGNDMPQICGAGTLTAGSGKLKRTFRSEASISPNRSPAFYRVLEFLSCGSIEAATNGQTLCSNKISYLLNLTGMETLRKKTTMACNCGDNKFHQPIERFVDIEKEATAQVLIFNADGQDSCQAMALQYIMQYHRLPLKNAWEYLKNIEGGAEIKLSENFNEALQLWNKQLEEQRKAERASVWRDGRERPSSVDSVGSFHSQRKIAWI